MSIASIYGGWCNIAYIIVTWLSIFPLAIGLVLQNVFKIGIYHDVKWPDWAETLIKKIYTGWTCSSNSEPICKKFRRIFSVYLNLTFPLLVTFMVIIKNTSYINNISYYDAFFLSCIITLAVLIIIRVLSNPCNLIINSMPDLHEAHHENLNTYREFVLSFFYSFILATLAVFLIIVSYVIWFNINLDVTFNVGDYMPILIGYLLFLIIVTAIGEILLIALKPANHREVSSSGMN